MSFPSLLSVAWCVKLLAWYQAQKLIGTSSRSIQTRASWPSSGTCKNKKGFAFLDWKQHWGSTSGRVVFWHIPDLDTSYHALWCLIGCTYTWHMAFVARSLDACVASWRMLGSVKAGWKTSYNRFNGRSNSKDLDLRICSLKGNNMNLWREVPVNSWARTTWSGFPSSFCGAAISRAAESVGMLFQTLRCPGPTCVHQ